MSTKLADMVERPSDKPVIATILGDAGLGKTSLACTFPAPIVIRAEDGLQAIPENDRPSALPLLSSPDQLWQQLSLLITEVHDFKTLIIDSVTALERLFAQDVIDNDPKNPRGLNQALGGYGNGPAAVGAMHERVRKASGILRDRKGMHVVFIAHAEIETIQPPDDEDYTRYGLRLGKRSVAPYTDDVDLVGFVKLQTFTKGDEGQKKKAISTGDRVVVCHATASNISKNRFNIESEIDFIKGKNPFSGIIAGL
jgi:hypothetical protein